jgi:thiol-disulfide isomerase/thioredoxin
MKGRFKAAWGRFRSHFWLSLLFDAFVIATIFLAIHAWQTRDLPIDQSAPPTVLSVLMESEVQPALTSGQVGIVYFFAPWCVYCRSSIGNLQSLVDSGQLGWGTVIALDYGDAREVQDFIDRTEVSLPVLMGTPRTAHDWAVRAFPTYYVIDAEGRISSRSVGYSSWLGMLIRSWMARY